MGSAPVLAAILLTGSASALAQDRPQGEPEPAAGQPAPAAAKPAGKRYDLGQLLGLAHRSPRTMIARGAREAAAAKVDEARFGPLVQVEVTAMGGPTPTVTCYPSEEECITTDPSSVSFQFDGVFGRLEGKATIPLYTFGKITAGRQAARYGLDYATALEAGALADAKLDAVRAYFGLKFAREMVFLLQDAEGELDKEIARVQQELAAGSGAVTAIDLARLRAARAEIDSRMAQARSGEATALAGIRVLTEDPRGDIDEEVLEELPLPEELEQEVAARAMRDRPEARAAVAGVAAAGAMADLARARLRPDVAVVAQGRLAAATNVDTPHNAFMDDPISKSGGAVVLAVRWSFEPGSLAAKLRGIRADAARAQGTAAAARATLTLEAEKALASYRQARDTLEAARRGERAARGWYTAVSQSVSAGLAESKEFTDSLVTLFTQRARAIEATYDLDVAAFVLARATGRDFAALLTKR